MDIVTAETIGKKSKALKHCDKLLSKIDKNGSASVKLNCTGVEFVVHKDDSLAKSGRATRSQNRPRPRRRSTRIRSALRRATGKSKESRVQPPLSRKEKGAGQASQFLGRRKKIKKIKKSL